MRLKTRTSLSVGGPVAPKQGEGGSITFIFIALLAIMMILVTAEARALYQLHREVKFLEQQQIKRINNHSQTKAVASPVTQAK